MSKIIFYIFGFAVLVTSCFSLLKGSRQNSDKRIDKEDVLKKIETKDFYMKLKENKNIVQTKFKKLSEKYCVYFGNKDSSNLVTEYYSFSCPHCLNLYRKDFEKIKKKLIKEDHVHFVFHPVPLDLVTIQAMICLEGLSSEEKCLFLDAILSEADSDSFITAQLMQKAMELLKKPIPQLLDQEFVMNHPAFQDAFDFISQEDRITAIPSVDINGRLFSEEIPEYLFIAAQIEGLQI